MLLLEEWTFTYGPAPNALFLVSFLIAENVFVITATKRLMSQKFRTITQIMKKRHETKYSESIMEYMSGVHWQGIRHDKTKKLRDLLH